MPSEAQLVDALTKADAAGDAASAQQLANMIKQSRAAGVQDAQQPAPSTPQQRAFAAGQQRGAQVSGPGFLGTVQSTAQGIANAATFGNADVVDAAARYAGQRLTGVKNPDDFSTDLAYVHGAQQQTTANHPYANLAGNVLGAAAPGAALAKGVIGATRLTGTLALKAAQPVANALRLAGEGAIGGGAYSAIAGGSQGAKDTGTVAGTAEGAVTGGGEGALAGGVAGPVLAGVAKGTVSAFDALTPASQRAIGVLAGKIGMDAKSLAQTMADFRTSTGHAPTIADVMNAKNVANAAPLIADHQSSAASMLEARDAKAAALPQQMQSGIEAGGTTPTPLAATPTLATARVGDLKIAQNAQMNQTMGDRSRPQALANQPVAVSPQEQVVLNSPLVHLAVRNDPILRQRLGDMNDEIGARGQSASMTVDDFDRLRNALRSMQTQTLNPNSVNSGHPQLAANYGQAADDVSQIASQQHPQYGQALDAYGRQQDLIAGFEHAQAGKSLYDVPSMGDIRSLDTPEGRAGLELGARSRLAQTAGETESGALSTADNLRQGAPSKTLESLPASEGAALKARGAAEAQGMTNYNALSPSAVPDQGAKTVQGLKNVAEGAVALGGHALTGFKAHSIFRLLTAQKVRESTANAIVELLTKASRTPAEDAELVNQVNRANLRADQRRLILKQMSRGGGAAGAAVARPFLSPQQ